MVIFQVVRRVDGCDHCLKICNSQRVNIILNPIKIPKPLKFILTPQKRLNDECPIHFGNVGFNWREENFLWNKKVLFVKRSKHLPPFSLDYKSFYEKVSKDGGDKASTRTSLNQLEESREFLRRLPVPYDEKEAVYELTLKLTPLFKQLAG